jgi:S1-C subfamily serine protease
MSGIAIDPDLIAGAKVFKVRQVLSNTPASDVGVREADLITAIDGEPAARFTQSQIEKMFMQSGREYVLTIKRGEQTLQMRLKLRRLI